MTDLMPAFVQQPNGVVIPVWHDETDPRWLIASFLRSDIGLSIEVAESVLAGLDRILKDQLDSWRFDGNGFTLRANRLGCCLELCDPDLPGHIKPVCLPAEELQEIVNCWKSHIPTSGSLTVRSTSR